jgi:hypothetical protein
MRVRNLLRMLVFALLLTVTGACNSTQVIQSTNMEATLSYTSDPTRTSTMTLTPTITETPTITMTPTPPPDLELINYTLVGSVLDNTAPDWGWKLMGELRNNTDQPMILFAQDPVLQLFIDEWRDSQHTIWGPIKITPGGSSEKRTNCILYPGEIGVIADDVYTRCTSSHCPIGTPQPSDPVDQEVVRIRSYQTMYKRWDDIKDNFPPSWTPLYKGFHPEAENVIYNFTQDGMIHVSFDINVVFPNTITSISTDSWIIFFDSSNRIINVLYGDVALPTNDLISGMYHVDGLGMDKWCVTNDPASQCWRSRGKMTPENLQMLDHIGVFVELEDSRICQYG